MILRAAGAWLGTVVGKVVAGVTLVAIVILVWKWNGIVDHARTAWWGLNNAEAVVHTKSADTALVAAKKDSVVSSAATMRLDALLVTPEIRSNAGAIRVGAAAKTVIRSKDSEIKNLKTAVVETKAAAQSYKAAGERPGPRIQPYTDIGYTVSLTKKYGVPVVRAGVDYRLIGKWLHAKGELSYEPPPAPRTDKVYDARHEIRATVTAHITF